MKKFKVSFSFFILVFLCVISKNFLLLLNYFTALSIHELSHLFLANSKGYKLKKIKLDMFGMSIDLDSPIEDKDNFLINIAGPLSNLLMCLLCLSSYWLFPSTYYYLNSFCIANLTLALFNLLPIYPLDGGKIFHKLFDNKNVYRFVNLSIRFILITFTIYFSIINLFNNRTMFILISIFFATSNQKPAPNFVFFKKPRLNTIQKIELIKIESETNLYSLIKLIKSKHYTIFYCNKLNKKYFNQDELIDMSLKYPLSSKIKNCKFE